MVAGDRFWPCVSKLNCYMTNTGSNLLDHVQKLLTGIQYEVFCLSNSVVNDHRRQVY